MALAITERLGEAKTAIATGRETIDKIKHADENAVHKANGKALAPWAVGSAVCTAAGFGLMFPPVVAVVGGSVAVAALTAGIMIPAKSPLRFLESIHAWAKTHPKHTVTCGVAALVWFILAQILGGSAAAGLAFLGLAGFYLLSARWWQAHRRGWTDPDAGRPAPGLPTGTELEPSDVTKVIDPIVHKWTMNVSANGVLKGSFLKNGRDVQGGREYELHLAPGRQSIETVWSQVALIATGLGTHRGNFVIEEVAASKDNPEPDPSIISFKVVTDSPVRESQPLTGPMWETSEDGTCAWVNIGTYIDGVGAARWHVLSKNSAWGGFLVGRTGSGKSVILDTIAASIMASGVAQLFYIDGQGGASSPFIFENADWAIGSEPDRWDTMLTGLETLIRIRNAENRRELKVSGFTASRRRPVVVVIVDECHLIFNYKKNGPNWAERWADIARTGRKVGVVVIAASQVYTLDTFGGLDALRDNLLAGNGVGLKLGANQSMVMGQGSESFNPATLKGIPGYGMVLGGTQPGGKVRTAPFRSRFAEEEVISRIMSRAALCQPGMDNLGKGALNHLTDGAYTRRAELAQESDDALDELLRKVRAGEMDGSMPWEASASPDEVLAMLDSGLPDYTKFMTDYKAEQDRLQVEVEERLTGVKLIAYRAVRDGASTTAEILRIARDNGASSESYVFDALRDLKKEDIIEQVGLKGSGYRLKELTPS